jgi:Reverse transcriptase (RNA-dependent DNA polymerase)
MHPSDFRPISLINGVQRLFSKILAYKLLPIIGTLLTEKQTGFLKGRNIMHEFHYAQQVIQAASKQKEQVAILKADLQKAFDTLQWDFLIRCLQANGFTQKWIDWIQYLVLQGKSKVILNSVAGRSIILRRGV